jgi:3-hydroxyacyl-CoA dehydrogenase
VCIAGAGLIGAGWAVVFARAGREVRLFDAEPSALANALRRIDDVLASPAALLPGQDSQAVRARVSAVAHLEKALEGVHYVQESITEDVAIKAELFRRMDRSTPPSTILASSTSAIPPSVLFAEVAGRARCIVAHPFNPPYLLPLVEIVVSQWNDARVVADVRSLLEGVGQAPVVLHKEIPGFVANRLQAAVVSEAVSLIARGIVSAADLDRCMTRGLGPRWAFFGPLATMDLNADGGFAVYTAKFAAAYQRLCTELRVQDPWDPQTLQRIEIELRQALPAQELPAARERRDGLIAALLRLARDDPARGA